MIKNFKNLDYLSNTTPYIKSTYPDGMDVEIFSHKALVKASKLKLTKHELEHVTTCFINKKYDFKIRRIDYIINLNSISLSVDTIEEFNFVSLIIRNLFIKNINSSLEEIISYILNYLYKFNKKTP